MLTKLQLNNYILKNKYATIGKDLLPFVEGAAAAAFLLEMLNKDRYVIRSLSCGKKKFTIQQNVPQYINSVTSYLNEKFSDYIRKEY